MRKRIVLAVVTAAIAFPVFGGASPSTTASAAPIASTSCVRASTPGGVKCLAPGEYCSHKPGYAAAYRKAGFRCNRKGRLERR